MLARTVAESTDALYSATAASCAAATAWSCRPANPHCRPCRSEPTASLRSDACSFFFAVFFSRLPIALARLRNCSAVGGGDGRLAMLTP